MRANLSQDGTLTVAADTPTEAFALARWQETQTKRKGRLPLVVETTPAMGALTLSGQGWYVGPHSTVLGDTLSAKPYNGDCQ